MLKRTRAEAGDTLIEVLFAVTVFALVVVSALSIMNQGTAASQRSLEMSLVTQQIESQAETLRFLHEAYVNSYQQGYSTTPGLTIGGSTGQYYAIVQRIIAQGAAQASPFGNITACPAPPAGSFILNTRTAEMVANATVFQAADTYAKLNFDTANNRALSNAQGIWIEGIRSSAAGGGISGFIDFHIRACWDAPGQSRPTTFGTIVRLYEPRG